MNRLSDSEFSGSVYRFIQEHQRAFNTSPAITVTTQGLAISDHCCRILLWQTALGFEYQVLDRQHEQLIGYGECPRVEQAMEEAVFLLQQHEAHRVQMAA